MGGEKTFKPASGLAVVVSSNSNTGLRLNCEMFRSVMRVMPSMAKVGQVSVFVLVYWPSMKTQ